MGFKYEPKSGVQLVEFAIADGEIVSLKSGDSYESETQLLELPDTVKETKTETKETKASKTEEGGGS